MNADVPENAPEHCPGTQSEQAGKAQSCSGCPNQNICSSGTTKGPDPALEAIYSRMSTVNHKILVIFLTVHFIRYNIKYNMSYFINLHA